MKHTKAIFAPIAFSFLITTTIRAADIKIIADMSVGASSISADEIKGVFLATKTSLSDGSHVEPVLERGGPVHEAFAKDYLGKTDSALETYYRSLVFTGKASMPRTLGADADVVAYVGKTRGPSATWPPGRARMASKRWR
jgi:hypothetical protein